MTNAEKIKIVTQITCRYYGKDIEQVRGMSRKMGLNFCRQMAQALCVVVLRISLKEVGKEFSGRDHTTVLNSKKRIMEDLYTGARGVRTDFPVLRTMVEKEFDIHTIPSWKEALKQLLLTIPLYTLPEARTAGELAEKL